MLASGKIQTRPRLSDTIPMADIVEQGFKRLKTDKSLIKLLVKPRAILELAADPCSRARTNGLNVCSGLFRFAAKK